MPIRFPFRSSLRTCNWCSITEYAVLTLLVLSILWRGGKSMEITWLLVGVAGLVTIVAFFQDKKNSKFDILNPKPEIPRILWVSVMLFVLLTALSYINSTTQNYGLDEVLRTGAFALLFLWMIRKARKDDEGKEFIKRLMRILAITVVVACIIGVLVYVFQPVNRFVGTFFDYRFHTDYWPNAWAEFLLLCWPVVVYWALRDYQIDYNTAQGRVELLVRAAILGLVFGSFFLAYSRGATLALFAQFALWGVFIYRKTKPEFPWRPIVPIIVLISSVSFIVFLSANALRSQYYEVQEVSDKITFTASEGTSSVSERGQFWVQSLKLAVRKPLLGWGPYSFRFVQPQYQKHVLATSDHPHNALLKVAMERGILTAFLLVIVIGFILYSACKILLSKEVEVGTLRFSMRMLLTLGVIGVLLHNMIDFNMQFVGVGLPFWLLMGILFSFIDVSSIKRIAHRFAQRMELILAVLLLIIACYEGGYLIVSSFGRHAESRGDEVAALKWYGRSHGEWFSRDLYLSEASILLQQSRFNKAQDALDRYSVVNTEDARLWKRQGDTSLLQGDTEQAFMAYSQAYDIGRYNDLGIARGLIETYLASDQQDVIESRREEFDALLEMYAAAIERNAHHIALSPNVEEFLAISNVFAKLFRKDAPTYQVMAARVDHHARVERGRIAARPPGFLW